MTYLGSLEILGKVLSAIPLKFKNFLEFMKPRLCHGPSSPIRPEIKRDNIMMSLRNNLLSSWTNNERHSLFAFVYLVRLILFHMIDSPGLAVSSYDV